MAIGGPLLLLVEDGSLPKGLLPGLSWRGFGPSTTVAILPSIAAEETLGFLLMGLNPRRPYDEDYQGFIQLVHRQLSTSLTSALLVDRAKGNERTEHYRVRSVNGHVGSEVTKAIQTVLL